MFVKSCSQPYRVTEVSTPQGASLYIILRHTKRHS